MYVDNRSQEHLQKICTEAPKLATRDLKFAVGKARIRVGVDAMTHLAWVEV